MSAGGLSLSLELAGTEPDHASAEDRALRGRNLSAVRSLADGRSGCYVGPACPCRSQFKAINPRLTISVFGIPDPGRHEVSAFDRTQNSAFESYTTDSLSKHLLLDRGNIGDYGVKGENRRVSLISPDAHCRRPRCAVRVGLPARRQGCPRRAVRLAAFNTAGQTARSPSGPPTQTSDGTSPWPPRALAPSARHKVEN